jgi:AraC family transcriptional regulator of adaptative response/methylated-DNA-[protein]-cysteine methyltransferase
MQTFTTADASRYDAVRRRDHAADGTFVYAVLTTGVYCRPSCASRLAKPENVTFHATPDDAERAGYRPCKRCQPRGESVRERQARAVAAARRLLDRADEAPRLDALAEGVGLSAFHLHRLFKAQTGMTPREYAAARRLARVTDDLAEGATVTAALHDAGYASNGRFYEASGALGMKPSDMRRGGLGVSMRAAVRACSLGRVLVAATERGVCAVLFGESEKAVRGDLRERFPRAEIHAEDAAVAALAERVVAMIESPGAPRALPLDLMGTAFQQRVWRALRDVSPGETVTYAELARRIGAPGAARAVGAACGKNPVAVAVPCHRAVAKGGALGGYRWGLARKRALLDRERA